ncbi:RnfH family protein [Aestuariirhabdus sp. Z084]|uniref:RnfH family protein n=1 Tax=Aestuariirhabdus haliotis TaxID=2918751 RepID=UPI00201B3D05|nr:RnfH family protein [Aestuariirhabdus haliotis]MCL6416034.1 RnfH family protein [Aestuariirhabdus haliotis]MCL6419398.1 RnfH family protein [Aestuariirhabdus haliotis]
MDSDTIQVEVAYATPEKQLIIPLSVPVGTTMLEAAQRSGISEQFANIDLDNTPMGIFGKSEPKPAERKLLANERVEVYRPLIADPKLVRKQRAAEAKARKEG